MNCVDVPKQIIDKKLKEALEELRANDAFLLKEDLNERAISHRLAMYLQQKFGGWDVDCEYNRDHGRVKSLRLPADFRTETDDIYARTVYPDIIIHHRGTDDNLVVIEMKKTTNPNGCECDIKKLKAYKKDLCYCYAVFLKLRTGRDNYGVEKPCFI